MDNSDLIYVLRIGNIVKCKISNDNNIYTVVAIDGVNHKVMLNGTRYKEWISIDKIKPIKLTNEFILKIDDVIGDFDSQFTKKVSPSFTLSKNKRNGGYWDYSNQGKTVCQIDYLHELQNIYIDQHKESLPIEIR